MKCIFKSHSCCGRLNRITYERPSFRYDWPIVYICKYHKKRRITWIDVLNSRSNLLVNNVKMTHTNELSALQALDFWLGNCEKIVLCSECKGTGEKGDNINSPIPCKKCNCTGRT